VLVDLRTKIYFNSPVSEFPLWINPYHMSERFMFKEGKSLKREKKREEKESGEAGRDTTLGGGGGKKLYLRF
jgi:hypothetical protein